jgi:hypothetical protein
VNGEKSRPQEGRRRIPAEEIKKPKGQQTVQDVEGQVGSMEGPGVESGAGVIEGVGKEGQGDVIIGNLGRGRKYLLDVGKAEAPYLRILQHIRRIIPAYEVVA